MDKNQFQKKMNISQKVEEFSKGNIRKNICLIIDLKKSNWFGLGGPANSLLQAK